MGAAILAITCSGGCRGGSAGDPPPFRVAQEAEAAAREAREAATSGLIKTDQGEPLNQDDRDGLERAAKLYERIIASDPTAYPAFFNAGQVYSVLGDFNRTINLLEQYIELVPKEEQEKDERLRISIADSHYMLSRAQFAMSRYEEALREADAALQMYPRVPNYRYARAAALVQLGRTKEARTELREAIKRDPKHEPSRDLLRLIDSE